TSPCGRRSPRPRSSRCRTRDGSEQLYSSIVMPGLVPGIHAFGAAAQNVDGRDKPGHDKQSLIPMTLIQVIVGGLLLGAVYALFSSGLTLIWGMMNVINFAHGEFVMIGMYVAFLIVTYMHGGPLAFGPAAAIVLFLLGIAVYFGLIRAIMRGPMIAQILSTFGLALLLRYLAFWLFSANFKTLPEDVIPGVLNVGGILIGMPQLVAGIAALALTLGMHLVLTRTALGSQLLAVAED